MTDHSPTDAFVRASDYLDGELDAAEMARAEADPEVMAEVQRLRDLRRAIADTPPPTVDARERSIAAAMAAFDELYDGAATPANVVRFRPRPAYTRWLGVAAAAVCLGVLGVLIATVGRGDDDDSGDFAAEAPAATEMAEADLADDDAASRAIDAPDATESIAMEESAGVLAADAGTALEAPAAGGDAAEATSAPSATEAPAAEITSDGGAPPFDPGTPISDEATLARVGRSLLATQSPATTTLATAACAGEAAPYRVLAEGTYLIDGEPTPVLIAVDEATTETVALDRDTCNVVARGR